MMNQPQDLLHPAQGTSRRTFLATLGTGIAGVTFANPLLASTDPSSDLIKSINKEVVLKGRDGSGPTWFHPRACMVPTENGPMVLMNLQTISGSDYFGPVHWMSSLDYGKTWTRPEPVEALGRVQEENWEEGVCDVTPQWHPQTKSVLALGHNVYYSGPRFSSNQPPRWPIYAVWKDGKWGPRQKLTWDDPRGAYIYTNNCGQRVVLPNGDILMSFTYGPDKKQARSVSGVISSFDGEKLTIKEVGPAITNNKGRGLLEPSVTEFQGKYYITIRAEDSRGYVCVSEDGLNYSEKQAWAWEDGTPLGLSTTQQHWLAHSDALWLVYTRKDASNVNVGRWRSPLWMAQMNPKTLRLIKETEHVVLPLVGDGVNDPNKVAYMGNFSTLNVTPEESWVTVGEWQPRNGIKGDLLLARIQWAKRNELVGY